MNVTDDLAEVQRRVKQARWETCFVVNEERVVLGRLERCALDEEGGTVEELMTEGPSTVRPSIGIDALLERMEAVNLASFAVTTPDGRLVGLVLREDAERAAHPLRSRAERASTETPSRSCDLGVHRGRARSVHTALTKKGASSKP
jgi:predicted transcriptional regulator